ncbi:MAG: DNA-directed RNA polymerase subunit omega [Bacteroidales bacterium]|nr:DNA-directed RNA polymerase subunit omega [Bacteroidales bacterium]
MEAKAKKTSKETKEVKDVKRVTVNNTTVTRDIYDFTNQTGNVYETVAMLSKRANQISLDMKRELHKKIEEFSNVIDTMDEVYENREQIEVVRHFERMPKPTLQATQEYLDGEIYYRNPAKEDQTQQKFEALENEAIADTETK